MNVIKDASYLASVSFCAFRAKAGTWTGISAARWAVCHDETPTSCRQSQSSSASTACSGVIQPAFNARPTASMSACQSRARSAAQRSSASWYSRRVIQSPQRGNDGLGAGHRLHDVGVGRTIAPQHLNQLLKAGGVGVGARECFAVKLKGTSKNSSCR
jgi:hypothetical protein